MRLFYYKDEIGNFGDDLNPWLWSRLLPGFLDDDASEWLVGIGTLLNHKLPASGVKHIFGSGYGYGQMPAIDKSYNFICVRGPKTAEMLGLPAKLALTDAAILIRTVPLPSQARASHFGFIPHCTSNSHFAWDVLCKELGFNYINPSWSVDQVLEEFRKCEVVLCEAMHGAIVCDALRIPWIPVSCYDHISAFKWEDWLQTLDLPYAPISISSLYDGEARLRPSARLKNRFKRQLLELGCYREDWSLPLPPASPPHLLERAREELRLASMTTPYLSADAKCDSLTARCLEKLEIVRKLR